MKNLQVVDEIRFSTKEQVSDMHEDKDDLEQNLNHEN